MRIAPPAPAYPGWESLTINQRDALWALMLRALDAQKAGRLGEARRLYEDVVGLQPKTYDAVHMLGTVCLQLGDLDEAETRLSQAAELMPDSASLRDNIKLLRHRQYERRSLLGPGAIIATDVLRLATANGVIGGTDRRAPLLSAECASPLHIVVPGDATNAASNRTGIEIARYHPLRLAASLWAEAPEIVASSVAPGAMSIRPDASMPRDGTLIALGVSMTTLNWLPAVADSFEAIVVAVDAFDPAAYVELIELLPEKARRRVRFVARSAALLDDLGLPGCVDRLVFADPPSTIAARRSQQPRVGVFLPPVRGPDDARRWEILEWIRSRGVFRRILYPGRLPSRHVADDEEHLVGLATEWDGWSDGLDALFYWGAEGRLRQFDRLVLEAMASDLSIVADGYGDYAEALARASPGSLFFGAEQARSLLIERLFGARPRLDG